MVLTLISSDRLEPKSVRRIAICGFADRGELIRYFFAGLDPECLGNNAARVEHENCPLAT
jgi:hypothetical protein